MEDEFEVDAEVKQFLNAYFAAPIQQFLYRHATAAMGSDRRSLLEHLLGTARLLEKWECKEYLWRTGAFHSIYGSEGVFSLPVSLERREEVRLLIGSESEHLAYLFCAMLRAIFYIDNLGRETDYFIIDRFQMKKFAISKNEYVDLLILTLADWIEPITGKQHNDRELEEYIRNYHKEDFTKASPFLPEKAVRDFKLAYGMT